MEKTLSSCVVSEPYWARLQEWYTKSGRHSLPWRHDRSAWSIFLAETLLRRTRAEIVARVFPELIKVFPDVESVLSGQSRWKEMTKELGLPSRFDDFFEVCAVIRDQYDGNVPERGEDLLTLPGIGHYTSDAIRCFGLGESRYIVDTNTLRVGSRLTGRPIKQEQHKSRKARVMLEKAFGPEESMNAERNFSLLDLAALVCKSSSPDCTNCPCAEVCDYVSRQVGNTDN